MLDSGSYLWTKILSRGIQLPIIPTCLLIRHHVIYRCPVDGTSPIAMPVCMADPIAGTGAADVRQLKCPGHIDKVHGYLCVAEEKPVKVKGSRQIWGAG